MSTDDELIRGGEETDDLAEDEDDEFDEDDDLEDVRRRRGRRRHLKEGPHDAAVILDVDGTLVDSNDAHARAWVDAFAEHGITVAYERRAPRRSAWAATS